MNQRQLRPQPGTWPRARAFSQTPHPTCRSSPADRASHILRTCSLAVPTTRRTSVPCPSAGSLRWPPAGFPRPPVCPRTPLPSVGTAARQFSAGSRQNPCSPVTRSNLSPYSRLGSARSPCHSRALFPSSSPSSLSAFTPLQPHRPPVVPGRPGQAPHRPPPRLRRARPGSRWARPLAAFQCVCPQIPRYSRPPLAAPRPSGLMLPSQHATLPSTLRFTCAARLALVQFRLPRVVCMCARAHVCVCVCVHSRPHTKGLD